MKKRLTALTLIAVACLTLCLPAAAAITPSPSGGTAYRSSLAVELNGTRNSFQAFALRNATGTTNYVRVRDLAALLNGTSSQFNVTWDAARRSVNIVPGAAYAANGSEFSTPFGAQWPYQKSAAPTLVNGKSVDIAAMQLTDRKGGDYTYYQLKDLGNVLGFKVDWDGARKLVVVTTPGYQSTPEPVPEPEPAPAPAAYTGNVPDFTATLLNGSTITLSGCQGKKVLVNFWATWCGPCVGEMPALQRLHDDFPDQLVVLAMDCGEEEGTVESFLNAKGFTFPVGIDARGDLMSLLGGGTSIPFTVLIDEQGNLITTHTGASSADAMYTRYKNDLGL